MSDGEISDPRLAAVLSDLDELAGLPVDQHPAVYEAVHAKLRAVLDGTAGEPQTQPQDREQPPS